MLPNENRFSADIFFFWQNIGNCIKFNYCIYSRQDILPESPTDEHYYEVNPVPDYSPTVLFQRPRDTSNLTITLHQTVERPLPRGIGDGGIRVVRGDPDRVVVRKYKL